MPIVKICDFCQEEIPKGHSLELPPHRQSEGIEVACRSNDKDKTERCADKVFSLFDPFFMLVKNYADADLDEGFKKLSVVYKNEGYDAAKVLSEEMVKDYKNKKEVSKDV